VIKKNERKRMKLFRRGKEKGKSCPLGHVVEERTERSFKSFKGGGGREIASGKWGYEKKSAGVIDQRGGCEDA